MTQQQANDAHSYLDACNFNNFVGFNVTDYKMSHCTCIADKEITCIVHPTTRSLKDRIAELEAKVKRLEKALRTIAGEEQCVDNTMSNVAIARAALEGKG